MSDSPVLPDPLQLDDTDDAIALLAWLDAQPETRPADDNPLPVAAYDLPPDNPMLRALGGLLTVHQRRGEHAAALALLRRLLAQMDGEEPGLAFLLGELERHETRQREASAARLQSLEAGDAAAIYAAPEPLPNLPVLLPLVSEEGDHGVLFAVEIIAAQPQRMRPNIEGACAGLLLAQYHAVTHAADLHGLGARARFAWRFISENQTLSIALLVRLDGLADEATAQQAATEVWHTINGVLPLNYVVYSYRPVVDADRLAWLRQPGELASAFAVTRQEVHFEYQDKPVYHVKPLGMNHGSRQSMLVEMLRHPGLCVIDVQTSPTHWLPEEREALREMLNGASGGGLLGGGPGMQPLEDTRLRQAVDVASGALDRDLMFTVRVTVASTAPVKAASLPVVTALSLFGTSHYEIRPAALPEELAAAEKLLRDLTDAPWPRIRAPEGLERLLHLWVPDETLAAMSLPVPGPAGLPGLPVQQVKVTAMPPDLPTEGVLVGDTYDPTLNQVKPVHLGLAERARHVYIVGRTGTGKTTVLENMALQDIYAGRGVGVIDPHGDLIEAILARIPPERAQDVVLFDPAAAERPVGLNILDVEGDFEKNMVISEFMGLLYSIYDPGRTGIIGPRFEQAVRNAMHTAMAIEGSTLVDVMRILSNRRYARECLKYVSDPMVRAYYSDIIDGQSDFHKSEVLDYITSKFGRFTGDTAIRNVIGQSRTTIDFTRIMNEGRILLVNLAKGRIGQENSHFLGLLLVPRILISAFSRARQTADTRRPFYLYVDEFQNFTTPMLSTMLSEGRKYGLSLTLANQFISQLNDSVREAVFGNVGTLAAFQVGVKDALLLAQELYPVFEADDLVNFPAFHMALKMPLGGASGRPFMVQTRPSTANANPALAEAIRAYALMHYGRDTSVIDAELRQRFNAPPQPRASTMR